MGKFRNRNQQKETTEVSEPIGADTSAVLTEENAPAESNNFADAAAKIEESGGDATAPTEPTTTKTRGVIPDALGNNVKGERHCSNCGVKESDMLAQNPRYSLCKGVCVKCYGKLHRKNKKPEDMTVEEIQAKIDHYTELLVKKNGSQGRVEVNANTNSLDDTDVSSIESHGANVDTQEDTLAQITQ